MLTPFPSWLTRWIRGNDSWSRYDDDDNDDHDDDVDDDDDSDDDDDNDDDDDLRFHVLWMWQ